tara:strand:- start:4412 stop:4885 length:474 start_codon:yes stop_codon:yes gene_type:complete
MENIVHNEMGLVHLLASVVALVSGTIVLFSQKGTKRHKTVGYIYLISMLVVLTTALMIYRLFGGFNVFHFIAIVGFFYIFVGFLPVLIKPKNWIKRHVYFMYWSVIGLYAAFVAEIMVRIPSTPFWWMVGLGVAVVTATGAYFYTKHKEKWNSFSNL